MSPDDEILPRPSAAAFPLGPCHYCGQPANAFTGDGQGGVLRYYHTGPACPEALAAYAAYWATPEGQVAEAEMVRSLFHGDDRGSCDWYDPHLGQHELARDGERRVS